MLRRLLKIGAVVLLAIAALSLWRTNPLGPAHTVTYAGGGEYKITVVLWRMPSTDAQRHDLKIWMGSQCASSMMSPIEQHVFAAARIASFPYWRPAYATEICSA